MTPEERTKLFLRANVEIYNNYFHCYWKEDVFNAWKPIFDDEPSIKIHEFIQCHCECGKTGDAHYHFLLETERSVNSFNKLRQRLRQDKYPELNLPMFGNSKLKKITDEHHLIGTVTYILGPHSVNHKNGFAFTKVDCHSGQHPDWKITNAQKRSITEELREEFPTVMDQFEEWKRQNNQKRIAYRARKEKERLMGVY